MKIDCIIVGCGITGLITSLMLAKKGLKCLIVDKSAHPIFKAGETLSPYCFEQLLKVGVDLESELYGFKYSEKKVLWSLTENKWTSSKTPLQSFSVDRYKMEIDLIAKSIAVGNHVVFNSLINTINYSNFGWQINLSSSELNYPVNARLLLIASGRTHFKLIPESRRTYLDKLIAYTCITDKFINDCFRPLTIEAINDGWLYSNTLPANKQIFTAFTDSDIVNAYKDRLSGFEYLCSQSRESNLVKFLRCYPKNIRLLDARNYWTNIQSGKGWLLLGEAAYSIDPLSGLGIEKNLKMINFLDNKLSEFMDHKVQTAMEYTEFNRTNFIKYSNQRNIEYNKAEEQHLPFWERRSKVKNGY